MGRGFRATLTPFIPNLLPHEPTQPTPAVSHPPTDVRVVPKPSDSGASTLGSDDALLTLRLSSSSFLDSTIVDEWTQRPLFVVETIGRDSTILRADTNHGAVKIAKVHWPRRAPQVEGVSGVRVAMTGQKWKESEDFLKFGSLFTSRKFNVPGCKDSLKWRRSDTGYSCATASIKRPIAILDRTAPDAPPRLRIYESVLKQDPSAPANVYAEIPLILLDLLLVTALLLVTDAEEWKKMPNAGVKSSATSARSSAASSPASVALWRNMLPPEFGVGGPAPDRPLSPTTSAGGSSGGNRSSTGGLSDFPDTPSSVPDRPFPFSPGRVPPVPPIPEWATSASAVPMSAATSSSSMSGRRQLPAPPTAPGVRQDQQPWLRHQPSFSSSRSGDSRALPPHLRAVNGDRPSSSGGPHNSSSGVADYARRGSYDEVGMHSSVTPSQHPYALAGYDNRSASPNLAGRALPAQRVPPAAALPLPPKIGPEKHQYLPTPNVGSSRDSATPDGVAALGVRMREAALFGDLPPGRESVFDMPPPAYDAIFASPATTNFTSPTTAGFPSPLVSNFPSSPTSSSHGQGSPTPTPRQHQMSFEFGYGAGPSGR